MSVSTDIIDEIQDIFKRTNMLLPISQYLKLITCLLEDYVTDGKIVNFTTPQFNRPIPCYEIQLLLHRDGNWGVILIHWPGGRDYDSDFDTPEKAYDRAMGVM